MVNALRNQFMGASKELVNTIFVAQNQVRDKSERAQEDNGDRQPDSRDPIVRDGMGALWKRDLCENYEPAANTERVFVGNSLPTDTRTTILPGGFGRATTRSYPENERKNLSIKIS
jgi:hypothetical protein